MVKTHKELDDKDYEKVKKAKDKCSMCGKPAPVLVSNVLFWDTNCPECKEFANHIWAIL